MFSEFLILVIHMKKHSYYISEKEIKIKKRILLSARAIISIALVMLSVNFTAFAVSPNEKIQNQYNSSAKLLSQISYPTVSATKGEWAVIGLARSDYKVNETYFNNYYNNVTDTLKKNKGILFENKYSEYSRVVLALTSIGKDVTNVGGYNLLSYLADFNNVKRQGLNGPVWALIALDSKSYNIPKNTEAEVITTREKLKEYILNKELSGGGWAVGGKKANVDLTAMAVTALSRYYKTDSNVKSGIDRALDVLSSMQNDKGKFESFGNESCESIAQVIVCLTSLGINPDKNSKFIKNGNTLIDVLLSYSTPDGGFAHTQNGSFNQMATEQGFYALVAYKRFCNNKNTLFDMSDGFRQNESGKKEPDKNETTSKIVSSTVPGTEKPSQINQPASSIVDREVNSTAISQKGKVTPKKNTNTKVPRGTEVNKAIEASTVLSTNRNNADNVQQKIDKINERILSVNSGDNTNASKREDIQKVIDDYNSLSDSEKEKVKGINDVKREAANIDGNTREIVIYIVLFAVLLLLGTFLFLRIRKRRKAKSLSQQEIETEEEKQ